MKDHKTSRLQNVIKSINNNDTKCSLQKKKKSSMERTIQKYDSLQWN